MINDSIISVVNINKQFNTLLYFGCEFINVKNINYIKCKKCSFIKEIYSCDNLLDIIKHDKKCIYNEKTLLNKENKSFKIYDTFSKKQIEIISRKICDIVYTYNKDFKIPDKLLTADLLPENYSFISNIIIPEEINNNEFNELITLFGYLTAKIIICNDDKFLITSASLLDYSIINNKLYIKTQIFHYDEKNIKIILFDYCDDKKNKKDLNIKIKKKCFVPNEKIYLYDNICDNMILCCDVSLKISNLINTLQCLFFSKMNCLLNKNYSHILKYSFMCYNPENNNKTITISKYGYLYYTLYHDCHNCKKPIIVKYNDKSQITENSYYSIYIKSKIFNNVINAPLFYFMINNDCLENNIIIPIFSNYMGLLNKYSNYSTKSSFYENFELFDDYNNIKVNDKNKEISISCLTPINDNFEFLKKTEIEKNKIDPHIKFHIDVKYKQYSMYKDRLDSFKETKNKTLNIYYLSALGFFNTYDIKCNKEKIICFCCGLQCNTNELNTDVHDIKKYHIDFCNLYCYYVQSLKSLNEKLIEFIEREEYNEEIEKYIDDDIELKALYIENKKLNELTYCKICNINITNTIILPCKHSSICNKCFDLFIECPFCNIYITNKQTVFI